MPGKTLGLSRGKEASSDGYRFERSALLDPGLGPTSLTAEVSGHLADATQALTASGPTPEVAEDLAADRRSRLGMGLCTAAWRPASLQSHPATKRASAAMYGTQ